MQNPTCGSCRFAGVHALDGAGTMRRTTCRRRSPRQLTTRDEPAKWPIVSTHDWCGEHEPEKAAEVEAKPKPKVRKRGGMEAPVDNKGPNIGAKADGGAS